jgi:hypothetical protein
MAGGNIQSINPSGALTAMPYTSGVVVHLSGVANDSQVNILVQPAKAGALVIEGSDVYPNAKDMTMSVSLGSIYTLTNLDGTRFRQSDGTIDITPNASGNIYAWQ